jgi:hypothetical protein
MPDQAFWPAYLLPSPRIIAASLTPVQLLRANALRDAASIFNDSTSTLRLRLGSFASPGDYSVLVGANTLYEVPTPHQKNEISGVWDLQVGQARVTESVGQPDE